MGGYQEYITLALAAWVMAMGFGMLFAGPRGAGAVLRWPVRTAWRLFRHAVGGLLLAVGRMIRG